jgi:acetyltransferase
MTMLATVPAFRIRSIGPDDRDALVGFYAGLSPESRRARFHGSAPVVGSGVAAYFCRPDHDLREGLVAEAVDAAGRSELIGHVCLEPVGVGVVEMAIAVADSWQRRGVGRALLRAAVDWARANGFETLTASMLCGNAAILGLIRSAGSPVVYGAADGGTIEVQIRIGDALPNAA